MPSTSGQPIKEEGVDLTGDRDDITGDRDDSRSPDVSEHDSPAMSDHSPDDLEDSADPGLPVGERFPSDEAIAAGMRDLAAGHPAPWGYSPSGVELRAPIVGLGPDTGGSSFCESVKKCACGHCKSPHATRHDRTLPKWRQLDCTGAEIPCNWATWLRMNQRFSAEKKRKAAAEGREPSPPRDTSRGHRDRSASQKRHPWRGGNAGDRSSSRRGRSKSRHRGWTSPFF